MQSNKLRKDKYNPIERKIEPNVLLRKITGYWEEMFEKNKTSN